MDIQSMRLYLDALSDLAPDDRDRHYRDRTHASGNFGAHHLATCLISQERMTLSPRAFDSDETMRHGGPRGNPKAASGAPGDLRLCQTCPPRLSIEGSSACWCLDPDRRKRGCPEGGFGVADKMETAGAGRRVEGGRPLLYVVVSWIVLNAVFVIIWAMSGGGAFWPGWIMLLSAVIVGLRFWKRSTMTEADRSRVRSRGR